MTTTAHTPRRESSFDDPAALLDEVRASAERARVEEIHKLRLVLAWADLHCVDPADDAPEACYVSPKTFVGEGSPVIDEFCVHELAARLGQSTDSTGRLMTEVVELAHRLPKLWARVMGGEVAPWRARMIAASTLDLSVEAARFVDTETHWCAGRLTTAELTRVVDGARVRFMPELAATLEAASLDTRHVTFDVDQVGFDGTMGLEARLEIPDALALAESVAVGAEQLKALGSNDSLGGRRAAALGDLARRQLTLGLTDQIEVRGTASLPAGIPTTDDTQEPASPEGPARSTGPARTEVVLHVHVPADAITRHGTGTDTGGQVLTGWVEEAAGRTLTVEQIRAWCGRPDAHVTVKPGD